MEVWRSKKTILVAILIAVTLAGSVLGMSCSSTGGKNEQQTGTSQNAAPTEGTPSKGTQPSQGLPSDLLAKLAENLGIDQQKLADAFAQAQSEMQASMSGNTQPPSAPQNAAPTEGTPPEGMKASPGIPTDLLARVAEILGIDQQTLEDAFTKIQSEMQPSQTAPPAE